MIETVHAKNADDMPGLCRALRRTGRHAELQHVSLRVDYGLSFLVPGRWLPAIARLRHGHALACLWARKMPVGPSLSCQEASAFGCTSLEVDVIFTGVPVPHAHRKARCGMGNAITGTIEGCVAKRRGRPVRRARCFDFDGCRDAIPLAAEAAGPGRSSSPATYVRFFPTAAMRRPKFSPPTPSPESWHRPWPPQGFQQPACR